MDLLPTLHTLQDEFAETMPATAPEAPVAACAPWTARDLVEHLAQVHHWAAAQARRPTEAPLGAGPFDPAELYRACAAELPATFAELDPTAPGTTLVGPGPVAFWHRRQVHETLVHLWDLRTAGGLDADAAAQVWAGGIDEVVTMFEPRQVRLGRIPPLTRGVALAPDDSDGVWLLRAHQPTAPVADVTVRGPAKALALLLWHRVSPDEGLVVLEADRTALDEALATHVAP